jgi:negative regulator of flagellin synthesis FlgM
MSIDVKDVQQLGTRPAGSTVAGKADKAGAAAASGASGESAKTSAGAAGDSVSLTQTGMQLAQMEKQLAQQPAVDSQRVEQIRQKLQSGNYSIDPARIANKLLGFEFPSKS